MMYYSPSNDDAREPRLEQETRDSDERSALKDAEQELRDVEQSSRDEYDRLMKEYQGWVDVINERLEQGILSVDIKETLLKGKVKYKKKMRQLRQRFPEFSQSNNDRIPGGQLNRPELSGRANQDKKIDKVIADIRNGDLLTYSEIPNQFKNNQRIWEELLMKFCTAQEFEKDHDLAQDILKNLPERLKSAPEFMEAMSRKLGIPMLWYASSYLQKDADFVFAQIARFPVLGRNSQYVHVLRRAGKDLPIREHGPIPEHHGETVEEENAVITRDSSDIDSNMPIDRTAAWREKYYANLRRDQIREQLEYGRHIRQLEDDVENLDSEGFHDLAGWYSGEIEDIQEHLEEEAISTKERQELQVKKRDLQEKLSALYQNYADYSAEYHNLHSETLASMELRQEIIPSIARAFAEEVMEEARLSAGGATDIIGHMQNICDLLTRRLGQDPIDLQEHVLTERDIKKGKWNTVILYKEKEFVHCNQDSELDREYFSMQENVEDLQETLEAILRNIFVK